MLLLQKHCKLHGASDGLAARARLLRKTFRKFGAAQPLPDPNGHAAFCHSSHLQRCRSTQLANRLVYCPGVRIT